MCPMRPSESFLNQLGTHGTIQPESGMRLPRSGRSHTRYTFTLRRTHAHHPPRTRQGSTDATPVISAGESGMRYHASRAPILSTNRAPNGPAEPLSEPLSSVSGAERLTRAPSD